MFALPKISFVFAILLVLFVSTTSFAEELSHGVDHSVETHIGGELSTDDIDGLASNHVSAMDDEFEEIDDAERFKPKKCYKKCYKTKKEAKKYCYHPYSIKFCYYKKCIKVWVKKHGKRVQVLKCIKKKGYKCSCW